MIKRISAIVLLLFGMAPATSVGAQPFMPVSEIHRGMVGVGKTVFQGTQIDTFGVKILGVLRNVFGPQSDMILARLSGGPLARTGVIAGMSGSPVYIDGKLIGAVGYAIGPIFVNEPIAGITPISEMVALFNRPDTVAFRSAARTWPADGMGALTQVAVPLMFSGFTPDAVAASRDELTSLGFMPMQGGGGADTTLAAAEFEPGSSLGVQLIRGDMSVTGIGTLTHREGDRIVGFGHEMMSLGTTEMPMTGAYIHEVLSSQMSSFKLGVATKSMGAITQDRFPGIAGIVGRSAKMMPVRIDIASPGSGKTYRMEVFQDRLLGPVLLRMAVVSALISAEKLSGQATVEGGVLIYLKDQEPIEIEDTFSGGQGLGRAVLGLTQPLATLIQNPFQPVVVDSAIFRLQIKENTRVAQISGVRLAKDRYEPGDTLNVEVALSPYLGHEKAIRLQIVIPYYATGRAILRVESEQSSRSQDVKRAPGLYESKNLSDVIRVISLPGRNDVLVANLLTSEQTVTVERYEVGMLPESVVMALSQARQSDVVQRASQTIWAKTKAETDFVLVGSQTVLLNFDKEGVGVMFTGKGNAGDQKK